MPSSPEPVGAGAGGRAAAALLLVGLLATAWSGLYEGVAPGRLGLLVLLACVPAVATLVPRGALVALPLALAATVLGTLALALRRPVLDLALGRDDAWAAARAILPEGLRIGADSPLPTNLAEAPALVALLDCGLAALAAATAWQVVAQRRPVGGLLVVGLGLAYRWTVEPPGSDLAAGALSLAVVLVALALASQGRPALPWAARASLVGAVVVGLAAVGGGTAGGEGWWSWRDWGEGGGGGAAASLDLRQEYGQLDWPQTPRVALRVRSPRPLPLRAVALEGFDGVAFTRTRIPGTEPAPQPLEVRDGTIRMPGPPREGARVTQRIRLVGARSRVLFAAGRPQRFIGPFGGTAERVDEAVRVSPGLEPGAEYAVESVIPSARPGELLAIRGYAPDSVPAELTRVRSVRWGPAVDVPAWGSGGPAPESAVLGAYAPVRALARRVAGDATSPYAAVNRIEAHLRRAYLYDEKPPYPRDGADGRPTPPLADFLFVSRRGFCQQFAGSMALMLRTLGIPARVAVGYRGGRRDTATDEWVVVDRDAHAWVEVWFPGHGWLPFDPTPGRSAPNAASVSSLDYAPEPLSVDLGEVEESAVAGRPVDVPPAGRASEDGGGGGASGTGEPSGEDGAGAPGAGAWALAGLALLPLASTLAKAARRLRRRRTGDPARRVAGAVAELEDLARDLGHPPAAAWSAAERAAALRGALGIDARGLYGRAAEARFSGAGPRHDAAAEAWRELAALRRALGPRRRLRALAGLRSLVPPPRGAPGRARRLRPAGRAR